MQALDGLKKFSNAHGFAAYFVRSRGGCNGFAELGRAPDAFSGQQRNHRFGILLLRLALLPFLHGPGRLADVVHGVAEILEDARIDRAGTHVVFEPDKFGARFLELEADTPERFARREKFDRNAKQVAFIAAARTYNAGVRRLVRNKIL